MNNDIEERIERVVSGLLPESAFQNRYLDKATLSERMTFYKTPGVSIAVISNYAIEWARGFGVREWGTSDPVTAKTLFQAGSVSKPVFALAIMQLVQAGKLDLDEDVNKYLTSWKIPQNGGWQPRITLRQILSHSAGLTVHGFGGYLCGEKVPTLVEILDGRAPSNTPVVCVNILPSVQFRYSGGGTTVAQQLVIDLLKKPFPQIMRELVLDPLEMNHSTFEQPLPGSWAQSAATAHPWDYQPVRGKWHIYPEMAAAGLWTTPSDLARVGIELQRAVKGEGNRILSQEMANQMLTPQVEAEHMEQMGIGFFLEGKGESVRFSHNGWNEGFVTDLKMYKFNGKGAVVMINSNQGSPLIAEIERAVAREYDWPDFFPKEKTPAVISSEILNAYLGEYKGTSGLKCVVFKKKNALFLQVEGQPELELYPESETKFHMAVVNTELIFEKTEVGQVKGLILLQGNKQIALEKTH